MASWLILDCGLNHLMSDQTKPSALWTVTLQSAKWNITKAQDISSLFSTDILSLLELAGAQAEKKRLVWEMGDVLARTELDRQCAMWLHLVTCNALIYWQNLINIELYSVSRYEILCISYQNLQVPDNFSLLTLTSVTSYEISRDDDPELVRLCDGGGHRAGAAGVSCVSAAP